MRITGGRIVVLKNDDLRGVEIRDATVVLHTEAVVSSQDEFLARMGLMGVQTGATVITGSRLTTSGTEAAQTTRDLLHILRKPAIRLEFKAVALLRRVFNFK